MTAGAWTVALSEAADLDLRLILWWTRARFGDAQAESYGRMLVAGLTRLRDGPYAVGVSRRRIAGQDVLILRPRAGRQRAGHLLLAQVGGPNALVVLRIVHERMDLPRHLAPGA